MVSLIKKPHVHVWVHVATRDWRGKPTIACKCICGRTLSPEQIRAWPEGEPA